MAYRRHIAFMARDAATSIPESTPVGGTETWKDVVVSPALEPERRKQIDDLLEEYKDILRQALPYSPHLS
jgi:hypothetical protein